MPLNSPSQDVGFICPFVVIDPTDLGATTAVARNLLRTNVWQSPTYPRRRIPAFLPLGIKASCVSASSVQQQSCNSICTTNSCRHHDSCVQLQSCTYGLHVSWSMYWESILMHIKTNSLLHCRIFHNSRITSTKHQHQLSNLFQDSTILSILFRKFELHVRAWRWGTSIVSISTSIARRLCCVVQ